MLQKVLLEHYCSKYVYEIKSLISTNLDLSMIIHYLKNQEVFLHSNIDRVSPRRANGRFIYKNYSLIAIADGKKKVVFYYCNKLLLTEIVVYDPKNQIKCPFSKYVERVWG